MRVLIGCERFGVLREAFRKLGHDAWSCDLVHAADKSKFHIQGDVLLHLNERWDLAIFHPDCTYLAVSGLHWNKRRPSRERETEKALEFVGRLLDCKIPKIALENPIGCISSRIRKPDQIIQPWMFGEDASKATCLWLKNLPPLKPTNVLLKPAWARCECCDDFVCAIHPGLHVADCPCREIDWWSAKNKNPYETGGRYANQTPSGQNKLGPSPERAMLRAKTYGGVARAMAQQWS